MNETGEGMSLLPCVEVGPSGAADAAVVWMHGLGASGHDFEDLVPMLRLPRVRFVFPHAPRRAVTINMGLIMPAWYDIRSLGKERPLNEDERGIHEARDQIEALVAREIERGVPPQRVILAGFSQGAAIALYVGARHAETLGGIMMLSGYDLLPDSRAAEETAANRATPLLGCHGTFDDVVPLRAGRSAYDAHAHPGRPSSWHAFPMAHQICQEELDVIREWLTPLVS